MNFHVPKGYASTPWDRETTYPEFLPILNLNRHAILVPASYAHLFSLVSLVTGGERMITPEEARRFLGLYPIDLLRKLSSLILQELVMSWYSS